MSGASERSGERERGGICNVGQESPQLQSHRRPRPAAGGPSRSTATSKEHANTQPRAPRTLYSCRRRRRRRRFRPCVGRSVGGSVGRWSIMVSYHPIRHFHCRQREREREREQRHLTPSDAVKCKPHLPLVQAQTPSSLCSRPTHPKLALATTMRKRVTLSSPLSAKYL